MYAQRRDHPVERSPTPDGSSSPSSTQSEAPVRRTRRRAASRPAGPPQPSSPQPEIGTAPSGTAGSGAAPERSEPSEAPAPAAKKTSRRRSTKKAAAAPAAGRRRELGLDDRRGVHAGSGQANVHPQASRQARGRQPVRRGVRRRRGQFCRIPTDRAAAGGGVLTRVPGPGHGRGQQPSRRRASRERARAKNRVLASPTTGRPTAGAGESGEPERHRHPRLRVVGGHAAVGTGASRRTRPARTTSDSDASAPEDGDASRPRSTRAADQPEAKPAAAKKSSKKSSSKQSSQADDGPGRRGDDTGSADHAEGSEPTDSDEGGTSSSSRRRRRRRRSGDSTGDGTSDSANDSPETVVKVREPRAAVGLDHQRRGLHPDRGQEAAPPRGPGGRSPARADPERVGVPGPA